MDRLRLPLLSFCLFLIFGLGLPNLVEANIGSTATLTDVNGEVTVKKGGGKQEIKALAGMILAQGDRVRTGEDGSATVNLNGKSDIVLGATSRIILSDLSKHHTAIKLLSGVLWNKVKSEKTNQDWYVIETPISIINVKGTLFLVNVGNDDFPHVSVLDGIVNVKKPRTVEGQDIAVYEQVHSFDLKQEELDLSTLVDKTDRIMLTHMILDQLETAIDRTQRGIEFIERYEGNEHQDDILMALEVSAVATLLARLAENMMLEIERDRQKEIEQTMIERGLNWHEVKTDISDVVRLAEETRRDTSEVAISAGINLAQQEKIQREMNQKQNWLDERKPSTRPPTSGGGDCDNGKDGNGGDDRDDGDTPPPVEEPTEVWLDKNEEGTQIILNVKKNQTNEPIVALQVHFGFESDQHVDVFEEMDMPITSTFFSDLEFSQHQNVIIHHEQAELIFAQTLYGPSMTIGYSMIDDEMITLEITNVGLATVRPFSLKILDIIIIDGNGNPIELDIKKDSVIVGNIP